MIEVYKNIFIGDDIDCNSVNNSEFNIVHACKTCHKTKLGYIGNLNSSDPNYLIYELENNIYLNLVDMNRILPDYTNKPFKEAFIFINNSLNDGKKVLIHCNKGMSMICSIGMCYLAKNSLINKENFNLARTEFKTLYPNENLGIGFENYLTNFWNTILDL
jgi:hypothetical protein